MNILSTCIENMDSESIKNALRGKGFTMEQAAKKLGMSRTNLYIQLEKKIPDPDFVQNVKTILNGEFPAEQDLANGIRKRGKPYLSDIDAFAGKVDIVTQDIQEYVTGYIYIPEFTKADLYINVRGHSMYPKYAAGEIISLKRVNDMSEIQYGQVYVVVTEENRMLKYVRKGKDKDHLKLVSANKDYDDMEVERKKIKAMFLVLGKISKDVL